MSISEIGKKLSEKMIQCFIESISPLSSQYLQKISERQQIS